MMNLKTGMVGIILLLTTTFCYGQKSSDKVAQHICNCVEKKIPTISNELHLRDTINACMGQGMVIDMNGLWEEYGMKKETTVESVREIGRRLWLKLEEDCEKFQEVAAEIRKRSR